jgi:hypothetical protein
MTCRVNPADLAVAYRRVVQVNHYLVGVALFDATLDDLDAARQLLIAQQNALVPQSGRRFTTLERALDLIEYDIAAKQRQAA